MPSPMKNTSKSGEHPTAARASPPKISPPAKGQARAGLGR